MTNHLHPLPARRTGLGVTALAVATSLASCGLLGGGSSAGFDDVAAAADAPMAFRLPAEVPADATDIEVHVDPEDPGRKTWVWAVGTDDVPADGCEAEPGPHDTDGLPGAGDWPDEVTRADGVRCGALVVVEHDGHGYAWLS